MMTKTGKAGIFFINMRITANCLQGQLTLSFCLVFLFACGFKKEAPPVIPPVTKPLSNEYIGFGVITSSFTHISSESADDSPSIGYLRRSSLVKIIRRQVVKTSGGFQSWVLIDGDEYGWLKEEVMDIYSSEGQAIKASQTIIR
jgi:hypothetical protein